MTTPQKKPKKCRLSQQQLLENYFIEHRNYVVEIAAFLDRMERSVKKDAETDFRFTSLKKAIKILITSDSNKVRKILMALSDPTLQPLKTLDTKSAYGAFDIKKRKKS